MAVALYIAAFITAVVGIAHSYLGERYLLIRLFRRNDLPKLLGSTEFTVRVMRMAWHITSLAWLGFAALLVLLAHPPVSSQAIGLVVGVTFFAHGALSLVASRGRHLSWIFFFTIAGLTVYATRT